MSDTSGHARFRQYVRRATFSLILSDAQISALELVASSAGSRFDWNSINGLERRSLVNYRPAGAEDPWKVDLQGRFELTPIGQLVLNLLVEAGFAKRNGAN